MKSVVKAAVLGLMAFALQANALQKEAVQITETTLAAVRANKTSNRFLSESLGIQAAATLADVNKVLQAMSPSEAALAIGAMNSYAAKAKKADNIQNQMTNEQAAQAVFMQGGKLLSLAAAAQGGVANAAISNKAVGKCDFALDLSKSDIAGAPNYATRKAILEAGLLSRGDCTENPDEMTAAQTVTLWNVGECLLNKGLNADSSDEVRNTEGGKCLAKLNGVSEQDGIASMTHINTVCKWGSQKFGKMAAAAMKR